MKLFDHRLRSLRSVNPQRTNGSFLFDQCIQVVTERVADTPIDKECLGILASDHWQNHAELSDQFMSIEQLSVDVTTDVGERLLQPAQPLPALAIVMTMHWINDLPGLLLQCRRALAPGGLFVAAFMGGRTLNELRFVLNLAETTLTGASAARVSPYLDIRDAGALMARTGFLEPVIDVSTLNCTYASPLSLMHDLRTMNESNALLGTAGRPLRRDVLIEACRLYHEHYPAGNGRIQATFDIIGITSWAPNSDRLDQDKVLSSG